MPLLYSYIRWSSDRQAKGTTLERQLASAKAFALSKGLELVEITDPGVSAFRGKNQQHGKLGDFIDAVKNGVIPSDTWLYVENLDRLTRQDITTAQKLFIELLDLGLTLVTGMDKRIYTLDSVNKNPTELMISILLFSRAYEESKTKQTRTVGNVEALVDRHKQGLPVNIKSCGKHPFWIDDTGSQYESVRQHPKYWTIAREAIEMFLEGHGIYKVKRHLDEKYPNGLNEKEWDYQVIKRMRESRALIGERTITIGAQTHKLHDYYPALCKNETEFLKLQELKTQNGHKSKKDPSKENIKLLSGLSILRCSKCGGTMSSFMNREKPRYICLNGRHLQKGCVGWSVAAPLVEHCVMVALLMGYMDANRKEGHDTTELSATIVAKEEAITELNISISNIAHAIESGANILELVSRLKVLSANRETLLKEVDRLKERKALVERKGSFEINMMEFINLIQWGVFADLANESRNKIRSTIDNIIEHVVIDKTDGCITIKIKCRGSDQWLVFGGHTRKPKWRFDIELYDEDDWGFVNGDLPTHSSVDTDDTRFSPFLESELFAETMEHFHSLKSTYHQYFDKVNQILMAVGYPAIDGSAFWPNR
ncbi:recombinase family protein [Buttiauxella noackiae]|uniref:recombinase family protein n=1 Tax=Buttiauxella noackiae TaxID=82992 RepID=UPI000555E50A|nr:recombinase family protein [Buttiauxella noackiae]